MNPTFGQILRGARMGYHWSKKHQAMIRIHGEGPFYVHICPPAQLPSYTKGGEHWMWWENPKILEECKAIADIKSVTQPIFLTVGEDGELLENK